MINYFKGWIYTLICISIITLIIELILPKNNLKKYVYVIIGIFTALILISPLTEIIKNNSIEETAKEVVSKLEVDSGYSKEEIEKILSSKNEAILKTVVEKMQKDIEQKTENYGVDVDSVAISINEKYEIEEIIIYANGKNNIERIKAVIKYISDVYGIETNKITIKCEVE